MNTDQWLASLFASIDARDAGRFAAHLAADGRFQFGNGPAVRGREAVAAAVTGFFAGLAGLRHELAGHWTCGDTVICHGTVTYRRHEGRSLSLPFANIMTLAGGLATDYRIFADVSPLYADAG